jgi:GT2 family glycosyltransferase
MGPSSLTIVIPVFNSSRSLPLLFNALLAQTVKPGNIIFIDNGSADNTVELLEDFKNKFSGKVSILKESTRGPAAARNTGITHVETELVGFFDSDVIPDKNWTADALAFMETHQDIDFVFGVFKEDYPAKEIFFRFQIFYRNPLPEGFATRKEDVFWQGFAMFSNGICKRDLLQRVGKLREDYLAGEDLDFHLRALQLGARIYLNYSGLPVHHYEKYTFFTFIKSRCMYRDALAKIMKLYFKGMLVIRRADGVTIRKFGFATVWVGNVPSRFLLIPFLLLAVFHPILLLIGLPVLLYLKSLIHVFNKSRYRKGYSFGELFIFTLIETAVAAGLLITHVLILFQYFVIMV